MNGAPSLLGRYVPRPALSDGQLRAMAARAWLDFGIVVIRPAEIVDDFDRRAVVNACERMFGKRNG